MHIERQVRLFRDGRNQSDRIPREFKTDVHDAIMRRDDDRLITKPLRRKGFLATFANHSPLGENCSDTGQNLLPLDDIEL